MNRLYCPGIRATTTSWKIAGSKQHHYLSRVLRVKTGDPVELFADGCAIAGRIGAIDKTTVHCVGLTKVAARNESRLHTHLGLCLSRGERMDYSVQKATELGAHAITPLTSSFSQPHRQQKHQHWQAISIHAAQQSGRCQLPHIYPHSDLAAWVANAQAECKLLLHEKATQPLPTTSQPHSLAMLIGPEGGLAAAEAKLARQHGFIPVRIGPRVLRCESVVPAMLAIVQFLWGDMQDAVQPDTPHG